MQNTFRIATFILAIFTMVGCMQEQKTDKTLTDQHSTSDTSILVSDVLSKEQQDALSPDDVIKSLDNGNDRFVNNKLIARDRSKQIEKSAQGQYPEAVILSCLDSRIPVEEIFDRGIGDIFVARVAGNFVNTDILGSMEFACKVSGAKLILVLGHNNCGAIRAAIDDVKLGNITPMLENIKPAIADVDYKDEKNSSNAEFVALVCESNIKNTMNKIRKNSPILKEMEDKGAIKIVGAVYNIENGKVKWLNQK